MQMEGAEAEAAVRKVFKFVAGVLNDAFGEDEAKKCEAELKLLRKIPAEEALDDLSFSSVCQTLSVAIDAGLIPEQGLKTLRSLEGNLPKHGLSPISPLAISLKLGDFGEPLTVKVVKVSGETTSFEVQPWDRVLDLKCMLKPAFGTKVHLTTEDNKSLDDAATFSAAGIVSGAHLTAVSAPFQRGEGVESAMQDVLDFLEDGETVEAVVFGRWGWGGYERPEGVGVPENKLGKVLTPYEAGSYMEGWSFNGGHGAPECYAAHIYTNLRILFPSQYDGATCLNGIPLRPTACDPEDITMPGG
mmetsp:Transcript_13804/g.25870  ORF Transcript_13804/g.25870 Transcript_13804/m.25870 type:complete len:302 (+) Transcript_13804:43-948(+)